MPFFDDTGPDLDANHGPVWGAFTALFDQLERYVLLNLAWALQLIPALAAGFFSEWSPVLRLVLLSCSAVGLAIATGTLFRLVYLAQDGETLRVSLVREELSQWALPSLTTLAPLYGIFGALLAVVFWAASAELYLVDMIARLLLLLTFVFSTYWGPLFASAPNQSALEIGRQSLQLFWRAPGTTLLVAGIVALIILIGIISVGGIFLIAAVVVALLQMQAYRSVAYKPEPKAKQR